MAHCCAASLRCGLAAAAGAQLPRLTQPSVTPADCLEQIPDFHQRPLIENATSAHPPVLQPGGSCWMWCPPQTTRATQPPANRLAVCAPPTPLPAASAPIRSRSLCSCEAGGLLAEMGLPLAACSLPWCASKRLQPALCSCSQLKQLRRVPTPSVQLSRQCAGFDALEAHAAHPGEQGPGKRLPSVSSRAASQRARRWRGIEGKTACCLKACSPEHRCCQPPP